MTPEIFTPGAGWTALPGATSRDAFGPDLNRWWYPRLWVAPDGSVVGLSSDKLWRMTTAGAGSITTTGTFKSGYFTSARPNIGPTSTAAMYDVGLILQVGGNGATNGHATPSSAAATVIDVNGPVPVLREQAPMANPRQWANATVLPDGRVVVTGGTRFADNAGADAVYSAEIWNPATGRWTTGRSAAVYRGYHSAAILLPNGTILSTGGGVPGPATNLNAEIYYPPYLFRTQNGVAQLAPRPRIASISALRGGWGQTLTLGMASSTAIRQVVLMGLGQTTHSFNSGQRRVPLTFSQAGTQLSVRLPASANLAPPGYYMVVAIDQAGVPSRGVILAIGTPAPPPRPAQPALQTDLSRSFQAVNFPDRVIRQRSQLTFLEPVTAASPVNDRLDASFIVRPGLADPSCRSFESRRLPGQYLRHYGFRLRVDPLSSATLYRQDATFCPRRPLDNSTDPSRISLESLNYPGRFLRHRNYEIWTDRFDGTPLFQQDSSFTLIPGLQ